VFDVTERRRARGYVETVNAFEAVTILVTAGSTLVGLVYYLRGGSPLRRFGRDGAMWFDHLADLPIEERPSEDELDAPIPRRPLFRRP
jgi:hypothetical protein